jgi:hypothetical protein
MSSSFGFQNPLELTLAICHHSRFLPKQLKQQSPAVQTIQLTGRRLKLQGLIVFG